MELKKIRIGGFRNIIEETISFGPITALVGLNGTGKTNVIDAIDFGVDFIRCPNASKAVLMRATTCIPLLRSHAIDDYEFLISVDLDSSGKSYRIEYGFTFGWGTNEKMAGIKTETLKIKENLPRKKYAAFIQRKGKEAFYKSSPNGRCTKKISITDDGLVLNKLLALDDLFYLDIIQQINKIQFFREPHLEASFSFEPAPTLMNGFQEPGMPDMNSIPRTVYFLKQEYPGQYDLLIDAFKLLFPNIREVSVIKTALNPGFGGEGLPDYSHFAFTDQIYGLYILDNRLIQPVRFDALSNGIKRVFLLLTCAIMARINHLALFAVEEPENSIHPVLFRYLLDVLSQLAGDCKILFTSHSPCIIQYLNPEDLYIGLSHESGQTDFRRIAPSKISHLMKDAEQYSSSMGNYIFELLSSEDANEALEEYVEAAR